jgi:hypothetical protein
MEERACPSCGAQNPVAAEYCWQCFTRFAGPPPGTTSGTPSRGSALAASIGTGPGAGTPSAVVTEPATMTRWQPQHTTPSDRVTAWVVKGLVVVLAAGLGLVGYRWLTRGFSFPDQIAGLERTDAEESVEAAEAIASIAQILGVEMEAAFYGDELQPTYVMFAFEKPEDSRLTGVQPFGGLPGTGIPFQCGPDAQGAGCVWEHDGRVVGIGGIGQTVEQLEPVARAVRAELQG